MIDKFQAILNILKYLIDLDENHYDEEMKYDTLHGIATNAFENKQRDPRIAEFLDGMKINKLIEISRRKDTTYYRISENGKITYKNTLKEASIIFTGIIQKELREEVRLK